MTTPAPLTFVPVDLDQIADAAGRIAVFVSASGKLDQTGRRVNRLTRGALERFAESDAFAKMKDGDARDLAFPTGVAADAVQVIKLDRRPDGEAARRAGVAIGKGAGGKPVMVLAGNLRGVEEVALGALLRAYDFRDHKT
ncbi:MAG: leucyl aminopeptidase, partial [Pseudomonadota bacterium]